MLKGRLERLGVPNASDVALGLLRGFPGAVLKFPPLQNTERLARDLQAEKVLLKDPSEESVRRISHLHGTDMRSVTKGFIRQTGTGVRERRITNAKTMRTRTYKLKWRPTMTIVPPPPPEWFKWAPLSVPSR